MAIFEKDNLNVNIVDGIATVSYDDDKVYSSGTDISMDTLKTVAKYNNTYVNEAAEVSAEKAIDIMKDNENVDKVMFNYPYGTSARNSVDIVAKRSQTYPGMNGGEPTTTSVLTVAVKDTSVKVAKSKIKELKGKMTAALLS